MQVKTGVDIVWIKRMEAFMKNEAVVKRTFHENELEPMTAEHCAGIFAAKEAFFKAIQRAPSWLDVQIKKQEDGKPVLVPSPVLASKIESHDVSISHDGEYAVASVVLVMK